MSDVMEKWREELLNELLAIRENGNPMQKDLLDGHRLSSCGAAYLQNLKLACMVLKVVHKHISK